MNRCIKLIIFTGLGCTLSLLCASNLEADYGNRTKEILVSHSKHEMAFKKARVLNRKPKTDRDQSIRRLVTLVDRLLATDKNLKSNKTMDDSYSYDPSTVINERYKLLKNADKGKKKRFRYESVIDGVRIVESEDGTSISREDIYNLRVFNDGHAFRFVDHRVFDRMTRNREAKITESEAEIVGRELIDNLDLIPIEDRDQLQFIKTRYVHTTGSFSDPEDRVVATDIYFGRIINGIPVIKASTPNVKLKLIADKEIASIIIDWTPIDTTSDDSEIQNIVDQKRFEKRFKGYYLDKFVKQSAMDESADLEIKRKACGYVDFGSSYGKEPIMQLGCMVIWKQMGSAGGEIAYIPLAEKPSKKGSWDTANRIQDIERYPEETGVRVSIKHSQKPIRTPDSAE